MWLSPTVPLLPNLGQSAPVQPQSHVPLACGPVHCPCVLPVCAPWVRSPCALLGCAAWGLCLCVAKALPGRTAWALCLGAACGRYACAHSLGASPVAAVWRVACGRSLCALPVHAAWALSTRSWHCAHDHQPMCAGLECPKSVSVACTVLSALRPCCRPSETTSDPTCEARHALFLSGSSHGCKATHEALPHADSRLRSLKGLHHGTRPRHRV